MRSLVLILFGGLNINCKGACTKKWQVCRKRCPSQEEGDRWVTASNAVQKADSYVPWSATTTIETPVWRIVMNSCKDVWTASYKSYGSFTFSPQQFSKNCYKCYYSELDIFLLSYR